MSWLGLNVAIKCGPAGSYKSFQKAKEGKENRTQKKFENRSDKMGHIEKKKSFCT